MSKIKIITGPTGSGKTFLAFKIAKKYNYKTIYMGPCRQLVYETAMKYGNKNSSVITGELDINKNNHQMSFRTFECCSCKDIKNFKFIIIDEAHFIEDPERGQHIINLITEANKCNIPVALITATVNFKIKGAIIKKLTPRRGGKFFVEECSLKKSIKLMKGGTPTLIFQPQKNLCGRFGGAVITADTPVHERLEIISKFNKGEISCIEATNCLAQGINLACENLINLAGDFDTEITAKQKLGRLGRMGVTKNTHLFYYGNDASISGTLLPSIYKYKFIEQQKIKKTKKIIKKIIIKKKKDNNFLLVDPAKAKNIILNSWNNSEK